MTQVNKSRLFNASCIALIVTAMTFAIRAGLLGELGAEFGLNDKQLGWMNAMAFLGFPVGTMIGGPLYNALGPRKIMWVAFISHLLGLILTIMAGGFWGLLISTFFIGFANGSVEAACNPMIADMYQDNKSTMLSKFHVWFPGGIVIGSLVVFFMTKMGMGWQSQVGIMLIPTFIYAYLIFGQEFPDTIDEGKIDLSKLFPPVYLLIVALFVCIAASDLILEPYLGASTSGIVQLILIAIVGAGFSARTFVVIRVGLPCWNKVRFTIADEVAATKVGEGFSEQRPVCRIVVSQKGFVQSTLARLAHGFDFFGLSAHFTQRVFASVVHGGGRGHWRRVKRLHLICAKTVAFKPDCQVHHV